MNFNAVSLIVALIGLPVAVNAQVNIEEYRTSKTGQLAKQQINFETNVKRSTTSLYAIHLGYIKPVTLPMDIQGFIISKINYGKTKSEEYLNDTFYHFRFFQKNNNEDITPEAYVQYENNQHSSTKERYLAGIGVRYHTFAQTISGTSLLNEWYKESNQISRVNAWRLSQYMIIKFQLNATNALNITFYFQPNIKNLSDIRYYSETQYTSKITNQIAYTSTLTAKYFSESTVFDDVELYFKSGLQFKI